MVTGNIEESNKLIVPGIALGIGKATALDHIVPEYIDH